MNKQGSVTMASIERYREEVDGDEQRRRNKNVSNWLMYCTKEEVIDVNQLARIFIKMIIK